MLLVYVGGVGQQSVGVIYIYIGGVCWRCMLEVYVGGVCFWYMLAVCGVGLC